MKDTFLAILIALIVLIFIGVLTSCSIAWKPAQQQKRSTYPQTTATSPAIPVDKIDLNNDGEIDSTELANVTQDRPSVLVTFMCIGGLVIAVCGLCVILSRDRSPNPRSKSNSIDMGTFSDDSEKQVIVESGSTEDEDWLSTDQDFQSDLPGGKRG